MDETDQGVAERCAAVMWAADAASQGLGMRLGPVSPGAARLSMPVAPAMLNGHGVCHGGFIFTLADSAFAYACNSRNQRAVAQANSITYLRPARLGDELTADAAEVAVAGRSGLYDVRITGPEGVVAEFRGQSRIVGGPFA